MAKLSVYNTIDRSQLGGKFVPLIQSGVSNYKILASDLGKEYHPGDAIEITDTGEINVKFRPDDFDVSSGSLIIKTDESRGVFKGTDGIYIASADSTIDVSSLGIKVNPEAFVGSGLSYHKNRLSVNAKAPLSADDNGLSLLIGGAGLEIVSGCLYLDSSVVSHTAADAVYYYMSTCTGSSLSIDQDYLVVNTKYIASAGLTTGLGDYNPISVDVKYVANAIGNNYIGSGLYWDNNNYTLSANVNTATGIIVNDNKLYLNAGAGLYNINNTIRVKRADDTINVSHSGIKVNTSALAGIGLAEHVGGGSLQVLPSDSTISVSTDGISVYYGSGLTKDRDGRLVSALYAGSGVRLKNNYISIHTGYGLETTSSGLCVKSADNTIDVSSAGIKVNTSALPTPTASSLAGNGLISNPVGKLDIYYGSGLDIDKSLGKVIVKSDNNSIDVTDYGIRVKTDANQGVFVGRHGVYLNSADSSIGLSTAGIKVNTSALAGHGLIANPEGKLDINYGSGLAIDTTSSMVYVDYGSGLGVDSSGKLYVTSSSTPDIGKGLWLASDNNDLLSVYAGSGLGFSQYDNSLVVKTVDNSLVVGINGLYIDPGDGLSRDDSGLLCIKSKDGSIVPTWEGLAVDIRNAAYIGAGLTTANGDLKVKNADSSLIVDSAGARVNLGYGLGLDESGGLACLVSHGVDGKNWCRKYQDGWIEQGGYANKGTITLVTPFSNTNYTCIAVCTDQTGAMGTDSDTGVYVKNKTTTNFYANIGNQIGGTSYISWFACGR